MSQGALALLVPTRDDSGTARRRRPRRLVGGPAPAAAPAAPRRGPAYSFMFRHRVPPFPGHRQRSYAPRLRRISANRMRPRPARSSARGRGPSRARPAPLFSPRVPAARRASRMHVGGRRRVPSAAVPPSFRKHADRFASTTARGRPAAAGRSSATVAHRGLPDSSSTPGCPRASRSASAACSSATVVADAPPAPAPRSSYNRFEVPHDAFRE